MTGKERERLERLEKRAHHLEQRVSTSDKDLFYDKGELSALRWAIAFIKGALADHERLP